MSSAREASVTALDGFRTSRLSGSTSERVRIKIGSLRRLGAWRRLAYDELTGKIAPE